MTATYLVKMMTAKVFAEGQNLTTQGEPGESLMVLTKGKAKVVVDGNEVATFSVSDVLGEASLTCQGHVRGATIIVRKKYYEWFRGNFADPILTQIITHSQLHTNVT